MIDEKILCVNCELTTGGQELLRLARLGIWAEAHAIPALEKIKAGDEITVEGLLRWSRVDMMAISETALAALSKQDR